MSSIPLPLILLAVIGLTITVFGALGIWRRKQERVREAEISQILDELEPDDGIIAVRKASPETSTLANLDLGEGQSVYSTAQSNSPYADDLIVINIFPVEAGATFAGFQLLQAVLGAGFRFGDMQIFHRHQEISGRGNVLFSLASATSPGTFDMEKMGLLSCPGLTVFMRRTFQSRTDSERFELMLQAAERIAEDLHGVLQDERRVPLYTESVEQIRNCLNAAPQYA